jgi:hypothetical protein
MRGHRSVPALALALACPLLTTKRVSGHRTGSNDSSILSPAGLEPDWTPVTGRPASIGVRMLDTVQDDVPQSGGSVFGPVDLNAPRSFSDTGTGLIGSLAIQRAFARSLVRLSYDRDTRSTGGSGRTNFDIDSFTLSFTHRCRRVRLTLNGTRILRHRRDAELHLRVGDGFATWVRAGVVDSLSVPVYQCFGRSSENTRVRRSSSDRLAAAPPAERIRGRALRISNRPETRSGRPRDRGGQVHPRCRLPYTGSGP